MLTKSNTASTLITNSLRNFFPYATAMDKQHCLAWKQYQAALQGPVKWIIFCLKKIYTSSCWNNARKAVTTLCCTQELETSGPAWKATQDPK